MADNVQSNPAVGGVTWATDDIGGVHYPRNKAVWGPDGTANETDDATGKRLPVKVGEALPAGGNNIGDVDVLTLPALPIGGNTIGAVNQAGAPWSVTISGTPTVDSELPAAVALADNAANPTAPAVGAFGMIWDGTTWDRLPGDSANGADVDVTRLPALPAGTNNIGDVDVLTLPALPTGANTHGRGSEWRAGAGRLAPAAPLVAFSDASQLLGQRRTRPMPTPTMPADGERRPLWTRSRYGRLLAERRIAGVDRFGDPVRLPAAPIAEYPGRRKKIEELRRRAGRREELFHPLDADDADDPAGVQLVAQSPADDDLVSLKQVAQMLGCSYKTLHRKVRRHKGLLPAPDEPYLGPYPARWKWKALREWLSVLFDSA